MKYLLIFIVVLILHYLSLGFINLTFDYALWQKPNRQGLITSTLIISVIACFITYALDKQHEE